MPPPTINTTAPRLSQAGDCSRTVLETPTGMIRYAQPSDYPEMQAVQISCVRDLIGTYYSQEEMQEWITRLEDRPQPANSLVHIQAGRVTAFVAWRNTDSEHSIDCLYTDNASRGRGIASSLLRLAEGDLVGKYVTLDSTMNARSFYQNRGYKFVEYPPCRSFKVVTLGKFL